MGEIFKSRPIASRNESGGNAFFMRYYIAMTKHIDFAGIGNLGTHVSYVIDRPANYPQAKGIAIGANFKIHTLGESWGNKLLNGFNLMAEYDARTVNIGAHYQLWKDHINLIAELNNGKYFSGGIYFKIHLK